MDSSIVSDPRFKLLAQDLDWSMRELIGACFFVWLACYERRTPTLTVREANACAGHEAFASAYASVGLGDMHDDGTITFHGASERIEFLKKQAERGAMGGRKSRPPKRKRKVEANAQANAKQSRSEAEANTPSLTPTPALTTLAPGKPAQKRKPDPLWDAFAEEVGAQPATSSERSSWNAALKQLREAEATAEQIRDRCAEYRRRFGNAPLTLPALAKHWGALSVPQPSRPGTHPSAKPGKYAGITRR